MGATKAEGGSLHERDYEGRSGTQQTCGCARGRSVQRSQCALSEDAHGGTSHTHAVHRVEAVHCDPVSHCSVSCTITRVLWHLMSLFRFSVPWLVVWGACHHACLTSDVQLTVFRHVAQAKRMVRTA